MPIRRTQRGFTLIEMMVSVALFAVVMMVSTGALLSLINADRKAQALQSVMGNLNIALDGMVRATRMGTTYHCGSTGLYTEVQDCPNGSNEVGNGDVELAFEPYNGSVSNALDQWIYAYVPPAGGSSGYIAKSEDGGSTWLRVTAPEVSIDEMNFYVVGTTRGDTVQPKVVITVKGTAGGENMKTRTTFNIQATAVQRVLDI